MSDQMVESKDKRGLLGIPRRGFLQLAGAAVAALGLKLAGADTVASAAPEGKAALVSHQAFINQVKEISRQKSGGFCG